MITKNRLWKSVVVLFFVTGMVGSASITSSAKTNEEVEVAQMVRSTKRAKAKKVTVKLGSQSAGGAAMVDPSSGVNGGGAPAFSVCIRTTRRYDTEASEDGIKSWNRTGAADLSLVSSESAAKIVIVNDNYGKTDWVGETVITRRGGKIVSARVKLNDYFLKNFNDTVRQSVVEHELGHAMGLPHTSNTRSVMYPSLDVKNPRLISAFDINSLENLYDNAA